MTARIDSKLLNQSTNQIQSKQPKQIGDFIIGKTLGQGNFGKVRVGVHKYTNEKVAIKFLQKKKISQVADVQRVTRQIHILKLIRHPNIVQLYQIIQTPKQLLLIMQYMQNGQLFDFIVKKKRISQEQGKRMFHQLIDGIEYIHKIGVAHRDLKPENILLSYDNNKLKIVDFGLSNTYKKKQLLKTPCGSPCYAAPQMIQGQKYEGIKIDIWSSGIILFAMLNGYLPFEDDNTNLLYKKVISGEYEFYKNLSQQARDLISKILNNNVNQRYTIQQIRNHPWMRKYEGIKHHEGIIVGYNKIPIDYEILKKLTNYSEQNNYNLDYIQKCIQANRHNQVTVAYYLTMKKYLKQGGKSKYDLGSLQFDKKSIQPVIRKKQNTSEILIDNFFTKSSCAQSTEVQSLHQKKSRLSKQRKEQQNKENIGIYMNRKKSKDKVQRKSKDRSKDNIKLIIKQQTHNASTQIMPRSTTNGLKNSIKMIQSTGQKRSQSIGKKSGTSTTKMKIKPAKLDNSVNYGRVPMVRSIEKVSGRQSQSHNKNHNYYQQSSNIMSNNHRQSMIQNRVNRKYKQKFDQSLISKSKFKPQISGKQKNKRNRINSTLLNQNNHNHNNIINHQGLNTTTIMMNNAYTTMNYCENNVSSIISNQRNNASKKYKDFDTSTGFVEEYLMKGKKDNKKTVFTTTNHNKSSYGYDSGKIIKPKNYTDSNIKGIKMLNQSNNRVVKARKL